MQPPTQLRKTLRARRRGLSARDQAAAADALAARLAVLPMFRRSRRVAFYYPSDGEIDPLLVMQQGWASRKRCYLPVLLHLNGNRLRFARVTPGMSLIPNCYGIPEPPYRRGESLPPLAMDLVLVPLVAFDPAGNRLGMGGGYYDRTLGFLRERRWWRRPHLVGIAHEFQRVDRLAVNPWDVPLDGVVTDAAYYPAGRG